MAPRPMLRTFLVTGAVCAVLPDIDAIGRLYRAGDIDVLGGHRGFTHSITFGVLLGIIVAAATLRWARWNGYRVRFAVCVALATLSHGLLDALTSYGAERSPVQFFSPFSTQGYTAFGPIHGPFSELFLCLLPLMALTGLVWHLRAFTWPRRERQAPVSLDLSSGEGEW